MNEQNCVKCKLAMKRSGHRCSSKEKVYQHQTCLNIRLYWRNVNKYYAKSQNVGFYSGLMEVGLI